jgi:hypothetical protein
MQRRLSDPRSQATMLLHFCCTGMGDLGSRAVPLRVAATIEQPENYDILLLIVDEL